MSSARPGAFNPAAQPKRPDQSLAQLALPPISFLFLALSIAAVFSISSDLLNLIGINYLMPGGNPLQKIHPATYFALGSVVMLAFGQNAAQRARVLLRDHPAILAYLAGAVALLAYVVVILKQPAATIVDTWICAGLMAALLTSATQPQRRTLFIIVHGLLFLNSLIGLYEMVSHSALIPRVLNDYTMGGGVTVDTAYWGFERAAGLFGTPLTASLVAGMLAVAMFAQIAFDRATLFRVFVMAHALAALPAFGGRTSIAVALIMIAAIIVVRLFMFMQGRGARTSAWAGIVILATLAPLAILLAAQFGTFDGLIRRMADDNGSAQTRLIAIEILKQTNVPELLFGDFNGQLIIRQVRLGTAYGIEIGWLALALHFGLIATIGMIVLMFGLLKDILRRTPGSVIWLIVFFVIASASGTGLSSKTGEFTILVCMAALLFPRRAEAEPRPAAVSAQAKPNPGPARRTAPVVHERR